MTRHSAGWPVIQLNTEPIREIPTVPVDVIGGQLSRELGTRWRSIFFQSVGGTEKISAKIAFHVAACFVIKQGLLLVRLPAWMP